MSGRRKREEGRKIILLLPIPNSQFPIPNSQISITHFQFPITQITPIKELFVYYFPEPPYFLMSAGLLAGMASGVAFEATLKQSVQQWSKNRSTRTLANLPRLQLVIPFLGMAAGICVFLASGMEIFGFPKLLSYALALPLTLLTGWLVWTQLGKLLIELERGGSQALDLDSFEQ
ncbi:hypothetical protein [Microcoleus sp. LAD1_D1]|uniref:hypothetical protein n=1 Tax=Microcoleus sp. LAD1_D1 TaxID=2818812 RepID=UPI002FD2CBBA